MKLTAREVRIIRSADVDWKLMVTFLTSVKKTFPNSVVMGITKTEPREFPETETAKVIHSPEMDVHVGVSKGGAPLKKKHQEQQMLLALKSDRSG